MGFYTMRMECAPFSWLKTPSVLVMLFDPGVEEELDGSWSQVLNSSLGFQKVIYLFL